jgi:exodeoxyribonuclease VII small subunit
VGKNYRAGDLATVANSKEPLQQRSYEAEQDESADHRKFEDELSDLEAIVARIDSGELSLDESIGAFERGVGLVRSLNQRLDEAERRVELLMRGSGGGLRSTPLQAGNGDDEDALAPGSGNQSQPGAKDDEDIPF